MTANRNLPLPLVIVFLALIRGCDSSVTTSPVSGTNPWRHLRPRGSVNTASDLPSDDYYNSFDDTTTPKLATMGGKKSPCAYNTCLESQPPCAELAASTGCLCPGVTLDDVAPGAPTLRRVSGKGSAVLIEWCAPHSYVTSYKVTVGGQEWQEFGEGQRSGTVGEVEDSVEVCVIAVNDAGASQGSCLFYQHGDNSASLKAGLIGGALGFLLLFSLGFLLWRHRMRRNSEARISTQDVDDVHQTDSNDRGGTDAL